MPSKQNQFSDQTYSRIYTALYNNLSSNKAFSDQTASDFSSKLIGVLSTALSSVNYFTDRKVQESYLSTAQSPYSIMNGAFSQTGTLIGATPSVAEVSYSMDMANPAAIGGIKYVLPRFTLFSINGSQFYTANEIVLDSSVSTIGKFSLVEGTMKTITFKSDGGKFQKFYMSSGFLSGLAVQVIAHDPNLNIYSEWTQVDSLVQDSYVVTDNTSSGGVLNHRPLLCYQASLFPDGTLGVQFGDGEFGVIPSQGTDITINYFECSQGSLNSTHLPGSAPTAVMLKSSTLDNSNVTLFNNLFSTSVLKIYGGSKSRDYSFYKNFSCKFNSSRGRVVSPNDLASVLMNYTFGSSNLKPIKGVNVLTIKNKSIINNTMTPILLMDSDLYNNPDFQTDLSNYLTNVAIPCVITPVLATVVPFSITIDVIYLDSTYSPTEIINTLTSIIQQMIPIRAETATSGVPNWDMTFANNKMFGEIYYLQDFYAQTSNTIGNNKIKISYNFAGSTDKVDAGSGKVLGLDYSRTLIGVPPITINFI